MLTKKEQMSCVSYGLLNEVFESVKKVKIRLEDRLTFNVGVGDIRIFIQVPDAAYRMQELLLSMRGY